MTCVYGYSAEVSEWVADKLPHVEDFGPCEAIGVYTDRLIAGVVYHDYRPIYGTIQLSMAAASPRWAKKATIRELLAYPFVQLGVYKAWIAVMLSNKHGLKTFEHIGFKREAVLAHQFGPRKHAVVLRMLRPDFQRRYRNVEEQG